MTDSTNVPAQQTRGMATEGWMIDTQDAQNLQVYVYYWDASQEVMLADRNGALLDVWTFPLSFGFCSQLMREVLGFKPTPEGMVMLGLAIAKLYAISETRYAVSQSSEALKKVNAMELATANLTAELSRAQERLAIATSVRRQQETIAAFTLRALGIEEDSARSLDVEEVCEALEQLLGQQGPDSDIMETLRPEKEYRITADFSFRGEMTVTARSPEEALMEAESEAKGEMRRGNTVTFGEWELEMMDVDVDQDAEEVG